MISSKIARQLTRTSRTLTRVVQAAAACCSVAITLVLAVVSGREPAPQYPLFAQQTLVKQSMQHKSVAGQPIIISSNEQPSEARREDGKNASLLRPALTTEEGSRNKSAWAANTVLAAGEFR